MNNKELFQKAYSGIEPSDELLEITLHQEPHRRSHRSMAKRAAVIAVSFVAVSVMSVSAAAVSGLINFNELFGKHYKTESDELSGVLMQCVENVVCETSDSDYIIEFKGAAGDETNIIAAAELRRADGTPVKDHFLIPTDDAKFIDMFSHSVVSVYGDEAGGYRSFTLNENGNIDMYIEITELRSMNGSGIVIEGEKLYALNEYWDDKRCKNDYSTCTVLELGWKISFDYNIPEGCLVVKTCGASEETFPYYLNVSEKINENNYPVIEEFETPARLLSVEAGVFSGRITFEYELDDEHMRLFENHGKYSIGMAAEKLQNEIFLIKKDGTSIPMQLTTGFSSGHGNVQTNDYMFCYGESRTMKRIIDIDNVNAVSINGTVYKLD